MATVSYDKLWKLLIDKKMNRTELREATGLSFNVIAKLGKCETVSMESLIKICDALQCDISNIVEIVPSNGESQ
ncbi:MAG: helix-turn-helix transcriptional regulator [Trichococcus flocculiformis]|uniref:Helix-turn-helix transcriptional regulator n=1 Tax=Trichococcus flocculiformis TaxID=82803 RepID=A0A847D3A5_9LACT|nr:helix-turn-helix transcriptional regulator [Trichococcus flocculiformis]NLD31160.1 helix-turn-helix transcriptional regulator [Trichococcus flocculiformis]